MSGILGRKTLPADEKLSERGIKNGIYTLGPCEKLAENDIYKGSPGLRPCFC